MPGEWEVAAGMVVGLVVAVVGIGGLPVVGIVGLPVVGIGGLLAGDIGEPLAGDIEAQPVDTSLAVDRMGIVDTCQQLAVPIRLVVGRLLAVDNLGIVVFSRSVVPNVHPMLVADRTAVVAWSSSFAG